MPLISVIGKRGQSGRSRCAEPRPDAWLASLGKTPRALPLPCARGGASRRAHVWEGQAARRARRARARRGWAATPAPDARKRIEEGLREAKRKVFSLRVEAKPEGAEILVNGKPAGRAPLEAEVFVEPGTYFIEARLEGYETEKQELTAAGGKQGSLTFELKKSAAPPVPGPAPSPSAQSGPRPVNGSGAQPSKGPEPSAPPTKTVVLIAEGGLAAVGLAVGIGFLVAKGSAEDERSRLKQEAMSKLASGDCGSQPDAVICRDLRDADDRADRNAKLSTIGFVGAGVAVLSIGATWLLWPGDDRAKSGKSSVGFDPLHRRLVLTGTF